MNPTKPTIPPEAIAHFAALAERVYAADSLDASLEQICAIALDLIPGADRASISVLVARGEQMRTIAATDDQARLVDELQNSVGEGPCLDALTEEGFQMDADISAYSQWPRLRERVLTDTPVRGMIGYRLRPSPGGRAALNIFSDRPGALDDEAAAAGTILAAFAGVTLRAQLEQESAANLRAGLESNREIGKAIGLLMATSNVDEAAAFDILKRASTRTNTRLAAVAAQVVAAHRPGGQGSGEPEIEGGTRGRS
ncbi:MAG TPA: ANTAR domain-containing protein [Tetrasphaera sp.]|uniref:ANTAR domain-containing protein n=1 Tax=Nostocoides sp. TaxID=1917966 RepID=UPI002BFC0C70|nr:ANTAR domain-containing protein [Tetrasphaera sp.]HNQ06068.1 ANTAR domain-containing protein [Tetrasphaera sp.]